MISTSSVILNRLFIFNYLNLLIMLQFQVIGNLGSDAEVKELNGNKAVCFNVAHTERWSQEDGTKRESTTWISCILNGDGG